MKKEIEKLEKKLSELKKKRKHKQSLLKKNKKEKHVK